MVGHWFGRWLVVGSVVVLVVGLLVGLGHWLLVAGEARRFRLHQVGNYNNILIIRAALSRLAPTNQRVINDLSWFCGRGLFIGCSLIGRCGRGEKVLVRRVGNCNNVLIIRVPPRCRYISTGDQ